MLIDIHWLRPYWLFALVPVIIFWYLLWRQRRQPGRWRQVVAPHLLPALFTRQTQTPHTSRLLLAGGMLLLLILGAAGPAITQVEQPAHEQERGIILVLDMSPGTLATDISPDRATQIQFKARDLLTNLTSGSVGLMLYSEEPFLVTPLTRDRDNVLHMLDPVAPDLMPLAGNNPLWALEKASDLLVNAGFPAGEIIWLTGGIRESQFQDIRRLMFKHEHRLSILGVGTEDGAPVHLPDGNLLRNDRGQVDLNRLQPGLLERLSRQTGGRYATYSPGPDDIERLLAQGPRHTELQTIDEDYDQWHDLGPYLALLAMPLWVFLGRRNLLFVLPLLFSSALFFPPSAVASPFLTPEQRAQRYYEAGEYQQAAQHFQDPMRVGQAWYRAGEYQAASDAFQRAAGPEARYNEGNSLARDGQLEAARDAYLAALAAKPEFAQARENLALVEQLLAQEPPEEEGHTADPAAPEQDSLTPADEPTQTAEDDPAAGAPLSTDPATEFESAEQGADELAESMSDMLAELTDELGQSATADSDTETSELPSDTAAELPETAPEATEPEETTGSADSAVAGDSEAAASSEPPATDVEGGEPDTLDPELAADTEQQWTNEELQELNELLQRVGNNPQTLLENRLRMEAERRRLHRTPRRP